MNTELQIREAVQALFDDHGKLLVKAVVDDMSLGLGVYKTKDIMSLEGVKSRNTLAAWVKEGKIPPKDTPKGWTKEYWHKERPRYGSKTGKQGEAA